MERYSQDSALSSILANATLPHPTISRIKVALGSIWSTSVHTSCGVPTDSVEASKDLKRLRVSIFLAL